MTVGTGDRRRSDELNDCIVWGRRNLKKELMGTHYCQHVFFAVDAVRWVERAQSTVGVRALNL